MLAILAAGAALGACRDAPEPFPPPERDPPAGSAWRLTFSPGDERAPAWSADGTSVLYVADGFSDLPGAEDVLLRLPFEGGAASPVLVGVQTGEPPVPRITTPAVRADDGAIAVAVIVFVHPPDLCGASLALDCEPQVTPDAMLLRPRLERIALRVRAPDATGALADDPGLDVAFEGRTFDTSVEPEGLNGLWRIEYHPFHRLHVEEDVPFYRPSWSPGGGALVFSDGLRLRIWEPGAGGADPVPGTVDGIMPDWSADGEWIAYTALERADPVVHFCRHVQPDTGAPGCAEEHTGYAIAGRELTIVRPDGSESRALGSGMEPAWAPDGTLYYRRDDRIWRRHPDEAEPVPVPGTEGGREPAVSPDGGYLAFARLDPDAGTHDLWIVRLDL